MQKIWKLQKSQSRSEFGVHSIQLLVKMYNSETRKKCLPTQGKIDKNIVKKIVPIKNNLFLFAGNYAACGFQIQLVRKTMQYLVQVKQQQPNTEIWRSRAVYPNQGFVEPLGSFENF